MCFIVTFCTSNESFTFIFFNSFLDFLVSPTTRALEALEKDIGIKIRLFDPSNIAIFLGVLIKQIKT